MESTRKIGRHHLAFYRGWLQGLDLKVAADRYLESGLDPANSDDGCPPAWPTCAGPAAAPAARHPARGSTVDDRPPLARNFPRSTRPRSLLFGEGTEEAHHIE